ncbi:oxidoreductase [Niastella koreensis]|uniref:Oxidoreductase domain protein n=2 Tax=Niastella koreensis TaxID=354356 RepID=G8TRH5_NIAKG|nr:Gfo/Idh/MocA family oxidoreductase [Niastella koreensis]AEW01106.1 oxidoreductase domain protein [Niastella koreensis GR20-10]OQP41824.1 oxidoreductase [Niastella koreensis]
MKQRLKIRVGIIGAGNWANYGHIPSMILLPDYEVVAIQSRRSEASQTAASKFGIRTVAESVEELVNNPEVDMVAVLTTAPQHEEGVRAAIAAGKDVYSEWPFTTSTQKAEELLELAKKAGVRHTIGLQRRLSPTNRYIADLIRDGFIGKLRSVRLHVSMNYLQAVRSKSLRWTAPPNDFSHTIAIYGGHFLDALFQTVGHPVSLSSTLVNQFAEVTIAETGEKIQTNVPDQLVLNGQFAGNAVFSVHIEGGKRNNSGVQLDITGDEGDLKITNVSAFGGVGEDYLIEGVHGDNLPLNVLSIPDSYFWVKKADMGSGALELTNLYYAFAEDVKNGTHTTPTFEDAVKMHKFFDLMNESSEKGKTIKQ